MRKINWKTKFKDADLRSPNYLKNLSKNKIKGFIKRISRQQTRKFNANWNFQISKILWIFMKNKTFPSQKL